MNKDAERLSISETDLEEAMQYIRLAVEYQSKNRIIYTALLQMAIICYCRVFKLKNSKTLPEIQQYKDFLKDKGLLELHEKIIDFRDELIAHSDAKNFEIKIDTVTSKNVSLAYLGHQAIMEKPCEVEKLVEIAFGWVFGSGSSARKKALPI